MSIGKFLSQKAICYMMIQIINGPKNAGIKVAMYNKYLALEAIPILH